MTRPLATPESTEEALLLYRAVDNPFVVPQLEANFEPDIIAATQKNTHSWVQAGFDGRDLAALAEAVIAGEMEPEDDAIPLSLADLEDDDALDVGKLELLASHVHVTSEKPRPF